MAKRDLRSYFHKLSTLGADVRLNEPMKWHTTMKIGGPAALFVSPHSIEAMIGIIDFLRSEATLYRILGGGSNVVFPDSYDGIVISTRNLNLIEAGDSGISIQAGVPVNSVIWFCLSKGLAGLEFLTGLPGTIGGAVFMNAGAFGGEIGEVVKLVEYIDEKGIARRINGDSCEFSYRSSLFRSLGSTVLRVELKVKQGDKEVIRSNMQDILGRRLEKQPLDLPSAGSAFVRPYQDFFVGSTIERLGLKALSVGDAQISDKHAGFIVNRGNATQRDVVLLIEKIKDAVREATGVTLEEEIQIWR